jgi:hypothetical protein
MIIKRWLILGPFKDTFQLMDYIWSNDMVVQNNKFQKTWIKAAVNYLKHYTSIHLEIIRKHEGNVGGRGNPNRAPTHTKQRC